MSYLIQTKSDVTLLDYSLRKPIEPLERVAVYHQVAEAGHYLHHNGFVHCSLMAKHIYVYDQPYQGIQVIAKLRFTAIEQTS